MTETTYDVRIWSIEQRKGKHKTTYRVSWKAGRQTPFKRSFDTKGLAATFHAKLRSAAKEGVSFDLATGLPVTMLQATESLSWHEFACMYVDMKWPDISPSHRRSTVQSLTPVSVAMSNGTRGMPGRTVLNRAIQLALNPSTRTQERPESVQHALRWIQTHSRPVSDLNQPDVLRTVLTEIDSKVDGKRAASNTIRLRRTALLDAIQYAIEKKLLTKNPLDAVKTRKPKTTLHQVDQRSVANPVQARTLLKAVRKDKPRLYAFFALMYFAALRPEEAAELRKSNLSLPANGWGWIFLERATPEISHEWTDSGSRNERRGLKHREENIGRTVPCSPELTAILHDHLDRYVTAADGRLFRGQRNGGRVNSSVYGRAWAKARAAVFTPEFEASPLAKRPYDLRHAAVSTWLNAGVEPTRVAAWAGHSVSVLLRVYAKCLDGGEQTALARVESALRGD